MNNYQNECQRKELDEESSRTNKIKKNTSKLQQQIINHNFRLQQFIETTKDSQGMNALQTGTIPIINIENHRFRDRDFSKEIGEKEFAVKHYLTDKDRVNETSSYYQQLFEYKGEYQKRLTNEFLRKRDKQKEGMTFRYIFNLRYFVPKNQTERVQREIKKSEIFDSSQKKMEKFYFPVFRDEHKNLNINERMTFHKKDSAWQQYKLVPFEKYQPVNSIKLQSQSNKSKEINRFEFISQVKPDIWETKIKHSNSIRRYKQDQALEKPDYQYSTNNLSGDTIKKSLIYSKSLNNDFPFQHTKNNNGFPLNNILQKEKKIYNNSVKQQLINLYRTNQQSQQNITLKLNQKHYSSQVKGIQHQPSIFKSRIQNNQVKDSKILEFYFDHLQL